MAENDDDLLEESSDDASPDEDVSIEKKKGLSKPLIIKIAIGVIVLIGAGAGAYFFLTTDEEVIEGDEGVELVEEDSLETTEIAPEAMNEESGEATEEEMSIELPELPENMPSEKLIDEKEDTPAVDEVGIEEVTGDSGVKASPLAEKKMDDLDKTKAEKEALKLQEENRLLKQKIMEMEAKTKSQDNVPSVKGEEHSTSLPSNSDQYLYNYQDEETYPSQPRPKSEPVPDAKWGEFERL